MPLLSAQLLFWAAVFVCIATHVVIVRSVLRASRRFTELAWAVVPAIVLAVVFVITWRSMHVST